MLSGLSMIIMILATVLTAVFILLVMAGKKYDAWIAPLDNKEFPLCELYGVGFVLIELFKYDFTTKQERKRRQQIALIYGEQLPLEEDPQLQAAIAALNQNEN